MNSLAVTWPAFLSNWIVSWILPWVAPSAIIGLCLRKYLFKKAENLATKQDIREITDKVEAVKTDYAKQLELFKSDIALSEKRREVSAKVVELINLYKGIPSTGGDAKQRRELEQAYYKLIPWIPTEILTALNSLFSDATPSRPKPDVKDVIIAVRRAIMKGDSGDFKGTDIIHFVEFGPSK